MSDLHQHGDMAYYSDTLPASSVARVSSLLTLVATTFLYAYSYAASSSIPESELQQARAQPRMALQAMATRAQCRKCQLSKDGKQRDSKDKDGRRKPKEPPKTARATPSTPDLFGFDDAMDTDAGAAVSAEELAWAQLTPPQIKAELSKLEGLHKQLKECALGETAETTGQKIERLKAHQRSRMCQGQRLEVLLAAHKKAVASKEKAQNLVEELKKKLQNCQGVTLAEELQPPNIACNGSRR